MRKSIFVAMMFIMLANGDLFCETSQNNFFYNLKKQKFTLFRIFENDSNKLSTVLSVGGGVNYNFYSQGNLNFLYSFQVIPRIYKTIYLSFRLDGHKLLDYNITAVNISISSLFQLNLLKNKKILLTLGGGATLHVLGKRGTEISFMPSVQLIYNLNKLLDIGIEGRKPVFFYKDSGHNQILLNVNLFIKL